MNLKYRQGTNMQRLGELVKKYRTGGNLPENGVDYSSAGDEGPSSPAYTVGDRNKYSTDEGFLEYLRATNQSWTPEYRGEALHTGGGSGSVRSALGDTSYAELAVNPELLPQLSNRGATEKYGPMSSPGGARPTRGGQQTQSSDLYNQNTAAITAYEKWLLTQPKQGQRQGVKYETLPGSQTSSGVPTRSDGFRITQGAGGN